MSLNTILATAPLTTSGYHIKANGTTLGNSLIWDNGTNVGIGNTNTSYTLDVSGTGRFTGNGYVGGNLGIGTLIPSGIVNGGGLVVYDSLYPRVVLQNSTTGTSTSAYSGMYMVGNNMYVQNPLANLYFGTLAGSTVMTVTSGGLVGIGCTPSYTLQVRPTTNVNMIVTNNGANLQIGSSNDAGNAAIPINFTATSFTFNSAATFSSTISASGTQYLGAGFAVSNDSASTIRQAASGVADFSGTTVTFDLASIFPRLTFTNRGLSVTLQLVAIPTYTIASSAFVVLGRTGNSNVWSNTILANININGVAVNSVSATGTVITVVYSTGISGTAYINVATIG